MFPIPFYTLIICIYILSSCHYLFLNIIFMFNIDFLTFWHFKTRSPVLMMRQRALNVCNILIIFIIAFIHFYYLIEHHQISKSFIHIFQLCFSSPYHSFYVYFSNSRIVFLIIHFKYLFIKNIKHCILLINLIPFYLIQLLN